MNARTFLLETALTSISEREDEKNHMHKIAGIILDKGYERMFAADSLLSYLTPKQCLMLTKNIQREITRAVDWELTKVERQEQEAVEFKGVSGAENPFASFHADSEVSQEAEDANPTFDRAELVAEMDRAYVDLQGWFLKAEKVVLGWNKQYKLRGLPFYTSRSDKGTFNDMFTFEEARMAIARDRSLRQEAAQREAASVFKTLAAL